MSNEISGNTGHDASIETETSNEAVAQDKPNKSELEQQSAKKKSPADAFLDLKDVVNAMRAELYDLKGYSSALIGVSEQQKLAQREEGRKEGIDALCRIHQLLYRKVANIDAGREENNAYIRQLYENVEGELNGLGVTVIYPTLSEPPQYEYMVAVGYVKSSLLHRPNTVSKVESCGYCIKNGNEYKVLKKAEIVVYRKASEVQEQ